LATTSASTISSRRGRWRDRAIYYEGRLAKLELKEAEKPKIDPEFEEITEGEESEEKRKTQNKNGPRSNRWSVRINRVDLIARDLLKHYDLRLKSSKARP